MHHPQTAGFSLNYCVCVCVRVSKNTPAHRLAVMTTPTHTRTHLPLCFYSTHTHRWVTEPWPCVDMFGHTHTHTHGEQADSYTSTNTHTNMQKNDHPRSAHQQDSGFSSVLRYCRSWKKHSSKRRIQKINSYFICPQARPKSRGHWNRNQLIWSRTVHELLWLNVNLEICIPSWKINSLFMNSIQFNFL